MDQIKIEELEQKINSQYGNTTGIVIIKDGIVFYEKYFKGCTADSHVHVYSVTKSVISILLGVALDKGYIKNIEGNEPCSCVLGTLPIPFSITGLIFR